MGKEPILIGLTGGISSGKSTVIQYIRYQGYPVIDADKLGTKFWNRIIRDTAKL